jgi:predicted N-acetyltransferase YhbS
VIVRPETVADYPAIAAVNARAFGRGGEAVIVSLHRHRATFDPQLSLVAEADGRVVGHALFSPRTIRLLDADIRAVCLGPIAVLPELQRQGIGAALIREGHRLAAEKGAEVSFLIGHRTYYPRFGYRTSAYGDASVTVPATALPPPGLEEAPVQPGDTETLREIWRIDEGAVDFAIDPGTDYMEWVSPNPLATAAVFRRANELVGYVRYDNDKPHSPRIFLSRDRDAALVMAAALAARSDTSTLTLPIHPRSASAAAFPPGEVKPLTAAMALELAPGRLSRYINQVERGDRPPGRVVWPVEFDR